MNSEQRVLGVLNGESVDRVPTFEWLISKNVIEALHPGSSLDDFVEKMDIDATIAEMCYKKEWISDIAYADEWGAVKQICDEEHPIPIDGPISTMADLDKYEPPNPEDDFRYSSLKEKIDRFKGDRAVIAHLNDVFSIPSRLMKFDDFMMKMALEPKLIEGIISMTVEVNLKMAKHVKDMGCDIVFTGDDYAYKTGPLMSPDMFEKIFHPYYKKVMKGYHDLGLKVIKHSDGNIMSLLDMIMDSDIDCIDPIEPVDGMSLEFMKNKYGKNMAIKGNVDCAHTLTFGSVDDVIAETKECLRVGAPGGRYICSSSNSIHSKVKPENYKAMVETIQEFGKYPIML